MFMLQDPDDGSTRKVEGMVITASGKMTQIEPFNGKDFTLEELQQQVGGYIQVLPMKVKRRKAIMIMNEEGMLHNLPKNAIASSFWGERGHTIVGTVVVCPSKWLK
jgi:hypothetical protein